MPKLRFVTRARSPHDLPNGEGEMRQSVATLGVILPLKVEDLRLYVRRFPLSWVEA